MAIVKYAIGGVEKTISVTLPAKFQVRLDWNTDKILAATDVVDGFANDPKDMYRYGTVTTKDNELLSFILLAQYTDTELESEESKNAYDELVTNYVFTHSYEAGSGVVTHTMEPIVAKEASPVDPTLDVIASNIQASTSFDDATKTALVNAISALASAANTTTNPAQ
jgi:hypothetical protein